MLRKIWLYIVVNFLHRRRVTKSIAGRNFIFAPKVFRSDLAYTSRLMLKAMRQVLQPGDRVLEIGAASGFNMILLSGRFTSAVGVEINPLAVACARLNLKHNGISNIELKEGNLFDVLKPEEQFDYIMFNPPTDDLPLWDHTLAFSFCDLNHHILNDFFAGCKEHLTTRGLVVVVFEHHLQTLINALADRHGLELHAILLQESNIYMQGFVAAFKPKTFSPLAGFSPGI